MAQNKAAQELAALTEAANRPVEQAERQMARDQAAGMSMGRPQAFDRDGDGEAEYAVPEGLATAVAAGFILGPVGGAVMGIAQAWLGKQERQNILDRNAAVNDTWESIGSGFNDHINDLKTRTENPDDMDQLSTAQAQLNAGLKMARSGDPDMAAKGVDMVQTAWGEVQAYTLTQETQQIEQDAIDEQIARDLTKDQRDLFISENDKFITNSNNYTETVGTGQEILQLLQGGNAFELSSAITRYAKLLDPDSAAMEGEVDAWRNIGGVKERLLKYANMLDEGTPLTSEQANELGQAVTNIMGTRKQMQLRYQARVQRRLDALDMPENYRREFNMVVDFPAVQNPQAVPWESSAETITDAAGNAAAPTVEQAANILEQAQGKVTDAMEAGAAWLDEKRRLNEFRREFYRIHGRNPTEDEINPGVN